MKAFHPLSMDNNAQPQNSPPAPGQTPSFQVNTDVMYDQGFGRSERMSKYFFSRVWPRTKLIGEGIIYFLFKVGRGIVRFALVQMGIRSGG